METTEVRRNQHNDLIQQQDAVLFNSCILKPQLGMLSFLKKAFISILKVKSFVCLCCPGCNWLNSK